jgi:GT2 family glycosyltransferase
MSFRESISPWLLRTLPVGSRRFAAAQLARDAIHRRAPLRDLVADAPIGGSAAQFRRWHAARPLPASEADPDSVVVITEPWHIPDVDPEAMVVFARGGDHFMTGARALIADTAADNRIDLVYWDDALIAEDGELSSPRFRPGWSPELLLAAPYLHNSVAIRRRCLDPDQPPCEMPGELTTWLWGTVLECEFSQAQVAQIPHILAGVVGRDDRADPAVGNASMKKRGLAASIGASGAIAWQPESWPKATVVIPTRHNREHMEPLVAALATTTHPDVEVVVIDNGPRTPDNEAWYRKTTSGLDVTVSWWDEPFNYSAVNNHGAALGSGADLVFLNDDALPLHDTWLQNLLGWLTLPEVGTVGALLLDGEGNIDHAGIVLGLHSLAGHLFRTCPPDEGTLFGPPGWPRNVMAVTGACTAVRRATFDQIGGFDERFVLTGSDVMLGVAAVDAGYRNVCTPWSRLRHEERSTRGSTDQEGDIALLVDSLSAQILAGDPWYSENLSLRSPRPQLRSRAEIRG